MEVAAECEAIGIQKATALAMDRTCMLLHSCSSDLGADGITTPNLHARNSRR